jgi:PIN domain nuclease of toxin-antitoxin system
MRLLLDTHSFLWFITGSDKLSKYSKYLIDDIDNACFLSVGSLWEMAIKVSIKKLEVPLPFTRLKKEYIEDNAIEILPIRPEHLDEQRTLPFHHQDPFDRLIISQAIVENMKVISQDQKLELYPVQQIWSEEDTNS